MIKSKSIGEIGGNSRDEAVIRYGSAFRQKQKFFAIFISILFKVIMNAQITNRM